MSENKTISKAQQKAVNKYIKNNYDRISVCFPKDYKAIIKEKAKAAGESVNAYINKAVKNRIDSE